MSLSKCPILESEPLCLRATGARIKEIDLLAPNQTDALQLYVSHNLISKLDNIIQFRSLERLLIEFNQLTYLEDLYPLAQLPKLTELRMEGNPICRIAFFEIYVIYLVPTLEKLNGKSVQSILKNKFTKEQLKYYIQTENNLLRLILMADVIYDALNSNPMKKIQNVELEATKRYPQNILINKYHEIRLEGGEMPLFKYLDFLKSKLIEKHKQINELAKEKGVNVTSYSIHEDKINANVPSSKNVREMMQYLSNMHDSACYLVEDEKIDRDGTDKKSRLSSIFSMGKGRNLYSGAKSVCSRYSIQKSRNKNDLSTITDRTDAQSILGYYLGPDGNVNNDAVSVKSTRSTRSSIRRRNIINKMKEKNNTSGKRRMTDNSSQASIDDVALNIENGVITLHDPKHPEVELQPNAISPPGSPEKKYTEDESGKHTVQNDNEVDKIDEKENNGGNDEPQNQNNKENELNDKNNTNPENFIAEKVTQKGTYDLDEETKANTNQNRHKKKHRKNEPGEINENQQSNKESEGNDDSAKSLNQIPNDPAAKQTKKVTLILSKENKTDNTNILNEQENNSNQTENQIKEEKKEEIVYKKCSIAPSASLTSLYFSKWKQKYNENAFASHKKVKSIYIVPILSNKVEELDQEIEQLEQAQIALSTSEQMRLIEEATKRRELLRQIENVKEVISHSTGRATQFQKEVHIKEKFTFI